MSTAINLVNDLMNRPVALLLLLAILLLVFLKRMHIDFPAFVVAVNNINSQPFALFVLAMGFWMLVECKKFGIDTTIAGGVIGVASNMLQSQIKDAAHPPGSVVKTTSEVATPPIETLPEPIENKPTAPAITGRKLS